MGCRLSHVLIPPYQLNKGFILSYPTKHSIKTYSIIKSIILVIIFVIDIIQLWAALLKIKNQ